MDSHAIKSVGSLCGVNLAHELHPKMSYPESPYFLSTLPTEMFRSILARVQILELIPLRLVSNRWKMVIESICSDKKCVVVMLQPNTHYLAELLKRFNLKELNKDFVVFKWKCHPFKRFSRIHLSGIFCTLLSKLFPRLEQFYILDYVTCSLNEFNSMLRQWSPSLTSLSVPLYHSEYANNLCAQISQLTNLKQLNLDSLPVSFNLLAPTLARLEHLSGWGHDESLDKIEPYLGENISGLRSNYRSVTIEELTSWHNLNAQSVSNLVRFSLYANDDEIFAFICKHFSSLQMLRINVRKFMLAPMIRQLVKLTHLTELQIDGNWIDLAALDDSTLRPLPNIRTLTLVDFTLAEGHNEGYLLFKFSLPENVDIRFITFLSAIFPNVEQMTIKCREHEQFGNLLEPHLNLFVNLRWHDFGLDD